MSPRTGSCSAAYSATGLRSLTLHHQTAYPNPTDSPPANPTPTTADSLETTHASSAGQPHPYTRSARPATSSPTTTASRAPPPSPSDAEETDTRPHTPAERTDTPATRPTSTPCTSAPSASPPPPRRTTPTRRTTPHQRRSPTPATSRSRPPSPGRAPPPPAPPPKAARTAAASSSSHVPCLLSPSSSPGNVPSTNLEGIAPRTKPRRRTQHRRGPCSPARPVSAGRQRPSPDGEARIFTAVSLRWMRVSNPSSTSPSRPVLPVMNGFRSILPDSSSSIVAGWLLT